MSYVIVPQQVAVPNTSVIIAENSMRILDNDAFTNGKNVVCDVFDDADGKNGTVNTGETDLVFNTDKYILPSELEGTTESATATSKDSTIGTTQTYSVAVNQEGIFSKVMVASIMSSSKSYTITIKKGGTTYASGSGSVGAYTTLQHAFDVSDYSDTFKAGETATITIVSTGNLARKANYSYDGTDFDISSQISMGAYSGSASPMEFSRTGFAESGVITIDANTLTLKDNENKICLWLDCELPSGITATYEVTDGTTTVGGLEINENNDISALSTGDLAITLTFANDGATENIEFFGYGALIIR